jgi:hypothetical protein
VKTPPSQSLTIAGNGILRIIQSPCGISQAFDPQKIVGQPAGTFQAIWDTGASATVITQKVIDQIGLKPMGMEINHTAMGPHKTEAYLVAVFLPNQVCFPSVRVTRGVILGTDMLIGMDIITNGDFAITNLNGKTVCSFRCPSREKIDFVTAPQNSVGRNSPCPCGSGKKYKQCCGKAAAAQL